jgi:hypothetical protein
VTGIRASLSNLGDQVEKSRESLGVVAGACFVAVAIRWLVELAASLHLALGATVATAFVAAALLLTHHVRRAPRHADSAGILGVLSLGLLTIMVVCAWASFTIHISGIGKYSVPAAYSPSTFVDFYMYTFLDILPGIEPLKTLSLNAAIESQDWVAGLPVLAFKLYVVWLFLDAYGSWRKSANRTLPNMTGESC